MKLTLTLVMLLALVSPAPVQSPIAGSSDRGAPTLAFCLWFRDYCRR